MRGHCKKCSRNADNNALHKGESGHYCYKCHPDPSVIDARRKAHENRLKDEQQARLAKLREAQ